jgi:KDO2-lipid IV(A) lauroyltransferase
MTVQRRARGGGYDIHVAPLPEPLPPPGRGAGPDAEAAWTLAAATVLNRAMEWQIGRLPSQYLWGYHRFKQPRRLEAGA